MLLLLVLPEEERLSVCPLETLLRVDLLRPESLRLELPRLELEELLFSLRTVISIIGTTIVSFT